ncbi:hypothetical protein SL054_002440 [Flavobacterium psychrophilum]|nr:hypothetical protein [Flavobacterium psychrophilum]
MKKIALIIIMFTTLIACKESDNSKNNTNIDDNKNTEESVDTEITEVETKEDFPLWSHNITGFESTEDGSQKGSIFKAKLTFKNNTSEVISKFELKYFIEIKFKDGKYYYLPTAHFNYRDESDSNHFDQMYEVRIVRLQEGEKWKPNETKDFDINVEGHYNGGNINNDLFERTPETLILAYKYKAIGIDNEFEKIVGNDILEYWKEYQTKLKLR